MSTLITDAFDSLILKCQAERYRPQSIEFYHRRLKPFMRWCETQGISDLEAITPRHVRAFMVDAQTIYRGTDKECPASGHTVHAAARALRAFFNFCVADEFFNKSPMASVKMPRRPKKMLPALELRDVQRLVDATNNDRDRALIYFLLDTGVRASECIGVTLGDVDHKNRSVHIRAGKGEKDRMVYFGEETSRRLDTYLSECNCTQPDQPLWRNALRGTALTRTGLFQFLKRLRLATGVTNCNPHAFRRAFALNCLRNGMDIYSLSRLMGHEDIEILRPYLALTQQDDQAAHKRYGVVDHLSA